MALQFIQDVFTGATTSTGDLTIPSGSIVSYIPVTSGNPASTELVFGLLETMYRAVSGNTPTYITANVSSTFNGTTLTRFYSFRVDLDFDPEARIETLNVVAETTTTTTAAP